MDAVRHVSGFGDAVHVAAQQARHSIASRTIDAAEAENRDREFLSGPERLPTEFGINARATAPGERGNGGHGLVDPGAAAVAVDAEAREIDHGLEPWGLGNLAFEHREHRIAA